PVFTNLLLADEVNRTPPKTQAALLEAMEERQVSVEGAPRPLPEPFLVAATQNPIEDEGTYPLPEAQLDPVLVKLVVQLPSPAAPAAGGVGPAGAAGGRGEVGRGGRRPAGGRGGGAGGRAPAGGPRLHRGPAPRPPPVPIAAARRVPPRRDGAAGDQPRVGL